MYSYGTFMLIYGKNYHNIVIFLQLKDKYSFKKKKKRNICPTQQFAFNLNIVSLQCCICFFCTIIIVHKYIAEPLTGTKQGHLQTWMDLESIIESEVSQKKKNK